MTAISRTAVCDTSPNGAASVPRLLCASPLLATAMMFAIGGCDRTVPPPTPLQSKQITSQSAQPSERSSLNRRGQQLSDEAARRDTTAETDPATTPTEPPFDSKPQTIHRPDDQRPQHDDRRLAEAGIRVYESERLKLYTDMDAEAARALPPLIDAVYLAWVEYFGELPPARDGSAFQMNGYLIRDEALFREAGLVPEDLPLFEHGRHRRNEFWMREQKYDYFRRHLLIHEATHCFMTFMPGVAAPVWYIEGMAEYFATHRIESDGSVHFRVMPTSPEDFAGWGRITAIREGFAAKQGQTIRDITDWNPRDFLKPEPYAWSWGLCQFLDAHPRYRERFRKLGSLVQDRAFHSEVADLFREFEHELNTEWELFSANLQYGYKATHAAIDFQSGTPLTPEQPQRRIPIAADRGWQSSGVLLEAGQTFEITASGRITLADQPKPWESEPQGITFRYFDRRPIGLVIGCLHTDANSATDKPLPVLPTTMRKDFAIGRGCSFTASHTGTLYLRVNDAWNSLDDNRGAVSVTVERSRSDNEAAGKVDRRENTFQN